MTLPGGATMPLDLAANVAIRETQQRLGLAPAVRAPMTAAEKREAHALVKAGNTCVFCAGLHVGASGPACPRLASGKLNGDGTVTEFAFWRDGDWDTSRVVFAADVEDEEVDADGDVDDQRSSGS